MRFADRRPALTDRAIEGHTDAMSQEVSGVRPDPVIEAYKKHVDRTLLRENLKLTPDERLARLEEMDRFRDALREAGQRAFR